MSTDFGPIIMGIGFGLAPVSSSHLFDSGGGNVINVREPNTFVCMSLNLGYKLVEQEDYNLILNMNLKEILGGPEEALGSSTSELFGQKFKGTKSFNENSIMVPKSPYGVSKLYSYWITKVYRKVTSQMV